jgi:hypothetical protein
LTASAGEGLRNVLRDLGADDYFDLSRQWHAREPEAIATVEATLAAAGLGPGVVRAQALCVRLREVEVIDRMTRGAEARRDEMLRQVDRHKTALARRAQQTIAAHAQMHATAFHHVVPPASPEATG